MENRVEIRCPMKGKNSHGNIVTCNRICVKADPGSSGEAWCKSCRMAFEFKVDEQARPATGIRVKPVNKLKK